jgi:hypothetical protein
MNWLPALLLLAAAGSQAGAENETSGIRIESDFPGGNIVLESIQGDDIFVHQDLRDTAGDWFYWCFRVRGAQGRDLTFHFTQSKAIGLLGPAVSRDGGGTWQWLGRSNSNSASSYQYRFGPQEDRLLFSFAMPYQEEHLRRFLEKHKDAPYLRKDVLGQSRKGRPVERLHLGCLASVPEFRVLVTCRHHACEMMTNYALEGLMEEVLGQSDDGVWLHEHVEIVAIPFVDKDGVEDGDQGKNRKPHDHCADYGAKSIYPEVSALQQFVPQWSQGKLVLAMDLHCPALAHQFIYNHGRFSSPANWAQTKTFFTALEDDQRGALKCWLKDSEEFTPRALRNGPASRTRSNLSSQGAQDGPKSAPIRTETGFGGWVGNIPGIRCNFCLELPYAVAHGVEVNQESARAFGHDLARALHVYLKADSSPARRAAAAPNG